MKTIKVTCGYREEYPNGTIYYYGGPTANGYCYKDIKAWESGEGIFYIAECEFEPGMCIVKHQGDYGGYTKQECIYDMAECLKSCYIYADNSYNFLERCAKYVLETCDWQHLTTFMEEVDWEEDFQIYLRDLANRVISGSYDCWDEFFELIGDDMFLEKYMDDYGHDDRILWIDIASRYLYDEELMEGDEEWLKGFGDDEDIEDQMNQWENECRIEALKNWLSKTDKNE